MIKKKHSYVDLIDLTKEGIDRYEEYVRIKEERTKDLLDVYSDVSSKRIRDALAKEYEDTMVLSEDYVTVINDPHGKIPVFDKDAHAADLRALEECKKLRERVTQEFKPGEKYSKAEIKKMLQDIYDNINYPRTAKASDLGNWFEIKDAQWRDKAGKRVNGFEIIRKRET